MDADAPVGAADTSWHVLESTIQSLPSAGPMATSAGARSVTPLTASVATLPVATVIVRIAAFAKSAT